MNKYENIRLATAFLWPGDSEVRCSFMEPIKICFLRITGIFLLGDNRHLGSIFSFILNEKLLRMNCMTYRGVSSAQIHYCSNMVKHLAPQALLRYKSKFP